MLEINFFDILRCVVLDHWTPFTSQRKFNLYKLFILYWAQNPHSNGAQVLYRHVIQKPVKKEEEKVEQGVIEVKTEEPSTGFSYLDGYNPPNLLVSTQHNSSDDDDSVRGDSLHITTIPMIKSEKEVRHDHG